MSVNTPFQTGKSSSLLSSLPRDVLDLPRMNSARRHVQLHEHRGAGGAQGGIQLLDKETGESWCLETKEDSAKINNQHL